MTIRVAIIDSGVNAVHSHVGRVAGGAAVELTEAGELVWHGDYRDPIGHGTAVAGVVRMLAPDVDLLAIKIVAPDGRSSAAQLVAAMAWALDDGAQLLNLSLGTANPDDAASVVAACERARGAGALVVASAPSREGPPMWPSCLAEVVGVKADPHLAPDAVGHVAGEIPAWRALGEPRPLPGQNQARNFKGSSFATARISGFLAQEGLRRGSWVAEDMLDWLKARAEVQAASR